MQKTICACLEIPSTGNRPAGMVAKNTLHSMEGLFLESHKSIDCHRPGYTRGISVCSGPCPSGDTTDAMSAGRPCLTFFELLVTRSSHLIFPAKIVLDLPSLQCSFHGGNWTAGKISPEVTPRKFAN